MAERTDLPLAERRAQIARMELMLAERRALLEGVLQGRLEANDYAVLRTLISEVIEQAEAGQEWVTIELSEEEKALVRKMGSTVGVEDSSPEIRGDEGVDRRGDG